MIPIHETMASSVLIYFCMAVLIISSVLAKAQLSAACRDESEQLIMSAV